MQIIVTLLLCGIACCLAAPPCSQEELEKCSKYSPFNNKGDSAIVTEDDLNAFCRFINCQLDFHDRCGDVVGPPMPEMTKQTRRIRDNVCDKQNPIRYKFLGNSVCMNKVAQNVDRTCKIFPFDTQNHSLFCEQVHQYLKCYEDMVKNECGQDAKEVFDVLVPGRDFYKC